MACEFSFVFSPPVSLAHTATGKERPSPPEPLTQHRERGERPRFYRLTVRVGGGKILSEAGDKGFGTGTLLSPLLQVSGMKSRLGGDNTKLKKARLLGSTPHLQSFTLLISIFFQIPNTVSSGGWTQKCRFILSLCFHIGRTIPFSAAATCFSAPQINRNTHIPTYIH